ncbi:MAG: hypothetical protein KDF63_04155, partial [Rhodoferax sp.]|nr:hypothetical protein [Rhodoferax sp.]
MGRLSRRQGPRPGSAAGLATGPRANGPRKQEGPPKRALPTRKTRRERASGQRVVSASPAGRWQQRHDQQRDDVDDL